MGTYVSYFGHHCNFPGEINFCSPSVYPFDRPQFTPISLLEADFTETARPKGSHIGPCGLHRYPALPGCDVGPVGRVCDSTVPKRGFEFETVEFGAIDAGHDSVALCDFFVVLKGMVDEPVERG